MSMLAGVGRSNKVDPQRAVKEALQKALKPLKAEKPDFLLIFSTDIYPPAELVRALEADFPGVPLSGCCGAGVITPEGIFYDSLAILAVSSDQLKFYSLLEPGIVKNPYQSGKNLAKRILKKKEELPSPFPPTLLLFPEGFECDIGKFLKGICSLVGTECYIAGGGSGDNLKYFKTYQLGGEEKVSYDGASATLIISRKPIGIGYAHGYQPLGNPMLVTKTKGRLIKELNEKPAFSAYLDSFKNGTFTPNHKHFPEFGMKHPLGICEMGEYIIRDPWKVNEKDEIFCVSEVPDNSVVKVMKGNAASVIKAAQKAVESAKEMLPEKPAFALIFDCISRVLLLKDKAEEEFKTIENALGKEVPFIGFLTFGEIVSGIRGPTAFHNKSIVVWTISS